MFKKKVKKIVFVNHPYVRGYAKLYDKRQETILRSYTENTNINSAEFEQLQEKMSKDNIALQWNA